MMLINPEGAEQSKVMFRKSIIMLLASFQHDEILAELKRIDAVVVSGRPFDALKAIRSLYPLEEKILSAQEITPAAREHMRREMAPWQ
jgi:flagellar protein FlbT